MPWRRNNHLDSSSFRLVSLLRQLWLGNFEVFVDFLREEVVDLSMGRSCQSAMPGFGLASSPIT
jgi:hypothetical protein